MTRRAPGIHSVKDGDAPRIELHQWPLSTNEYGNQIHFGIGNIINTH
jgi:hypothetical protein